MVRILESSKRKLLYNFFLYLKKNKGDEKTAADEPPNEGNNRVDLLTDKLKLKNTKSVQKVRAFTKRLRGETTTTMTRNTTITGKVKSPPLTNVTLPPPAPQCSPNSGTPRSKPLSNSPRSDDVRSRVTQETIDR